MLGAALASRARTRIRPPAEGLHLLGSALGIGEFRVHASSPPAGRPLGDLRLREEIGVSVLRQWLYAESTTTKGPATLMSAGAAPMIACTDQTGYSIQLPAPARRIISLVPSQTELLAALGLETETVGITKFCVRPADWFRSKTCVGGTKDVRLQTVKSLSPDLILANKEENTRNQVEALRRVCPVWTSDVSNLDDALGMIRSVGLLAGKEEQANRLAGEILSSFGSLPTVPPLPCLYLIWRKPYMAAGGGTFIDDMLCRAGFSNRVADRLRYPVLSAEEMVALAPECILLSSEPYPFREEHVRELQDALPGAKVLLADGEMFSWYGSRLVHAPAHFKALRGEARPAQ